MKRHAQPPAPVPPLFHYTGAGGMRGIIRSGRIWASGAQYMNDWMEVVYGYEIIRNKLRDLVGSRQLPACSLEVFTRVLQLMDDPESPFVDAYFAAFCEKGNLLSQWRAYAGTQGFAAEFDPLVIDGELTLTTKAPARNLRLAKVEYDPRRQDKALKELLDELTATIEEQTNGANEQISELVEFARMLLSSWAATVKHPGFEEEQEWRMIFQPLITAEERYFSTQEFSVRLEGDELVSHVEFMPNSNVVAIGEHGALLPIRSITCGPNVAMRSAMRALEILLRNNGYDDVRILKSEIPARG